MSERINPRPELRSSIQEFARLVKFFEANQDNPQLQKFITTAIIGTLSLIDLEEEELVLVQSKSSAHPQSEEPTDRITNGYTGFYLCSASEGRLLRSLEDTGVVLVNDFLLAKMVGKISVLALDTREGFMAGHWYAPRTPWMREAIRQAFDEGQSTVTIPNDVWDYMRQADVRNLNRPGVKLRDPSLLTDINSEGALLAFCRQMLTKFPEQFSTGINGMSRQEYRTTLREGA